MNVSREQARKVLLAKRVEVVARLRGLDDTFTDIVESARDSNQDDEHDTEGVTIAVSRAQVASLASDGRRRLEEIDAALARLEAGTYGRCERCDEQIETARLEARPATTWCIDCARKQTRRR